MTLKIAANPRTDASANRIQPIAGSYDEIDSSSHTRATPITSTSTTIDNLRTTREDAIPFTIRCDFINTTTNETRTRRWALCNTAKKFRNQALVGKVLPAGDIGGALLVTIVNSGEELGIVADDDEFRALGGGY